jgi:hypothetical protein
MKEKFFFSYYYKYSLLCALAYCVPVCFFLDKETYSNLWVLYLGNICYVILLLISGIFVNKKLNDYASIKAMLTAGSKVIFSSIAMICVILLILFLVVKSSFGGVVKLAPDVTDNLYYMIPLDATLVNLFIGFFGVGIGAVAVKQIQKNAKGQEIT